VLGQLRRAVLFLLSYPWVSQDGYTPFSRVHGLDMMWRGYRRVIAIIRRNLGHFSNHHARICELCLCGAVMALMPWLQANHHPTRGLNNNDYHELRDQVVLQPPCEYSRCQLTLDPSPKTMFLPFSPVACVGPCAAAQESNFPPPAHDAGIIRDNASSKGSRESFPGVCVIRNTLPVSSILCPPGDR